MKILLLSNKSPWPPRDGGSLATLGMMNSLRMTGSTVNVLALNTSKHYTAISDLPPEISKSIHLAGINTAINPLRLVANLLFSDEPYPVTRFRSTRFTEMLVNPLREKYNIVQIEGLAMAQYIPFIKRFPECRIVFRPHNVENIIWRRLSEEENNPLRKYYCRILSARIKRLEKKILNEIDGLAAISENDLAWFTEEGFKGAAMVSRPGFIVEPLSEKTLLPFSLFFIGALDWRPNITGLKWFIKNVWPQVINSEPDATFHVAGRNAASVVSKICRRKGIIFHGEVESSENFMSDKVVMVVPLFSGSGIRMKIIEGVLRGKMIVSTPVAAEGLDEDIKSRISIAENAASFGNEVIRILKDRAAGNEADNKSIGKVRENYNILVAAEKLLNFYRNLF